MKQIGRLVEKANLYQRNATMLHVQPQQNKKLFNKEIGDLGETVAAAYLKRKGLTILDRNYRKKWGEIDIVARDTDRIVHFVEVKTVSYETRTDLEAAVTRRTWRPEENVHPYKVKKLSRAIESWLLQKNWQGNWVIDVLAVRLVPREKYARVKFIPNIVL